MKLVFFLIAFCLICIRYYFSWAGKNPERAGLSVSNMVIKTDKSYEELEYSGKFKLSDDESAFKSMSAGGYFKFRFNDVRVKAESNLRGEIDYTIYDGKNYLSADGQGKIFVAQAIREMVDWGFDAEARMERVYQTGGMNALMEQVDSIRPDNIKVMYLNRLIRLDSGSNIPICLIIKKIGSIDNDWQKAEILEKFSAAQISDSATSRAYFEAIASFGSDGDKIRMLDRAIQLDTVSKKFAGEILSAARSLGSDMDKANLYQHLIDRDMISDSILDTLLADVKVLGSDQDKIRLYSDLLAVKNMSDSRWILIITQTSGLNDDAQKAQLLSEIAPKMPKNEAVKSCYLKAAKTIRNDMDYGKALRGIE